MTATATARPIVAASSTRARRSGGGAVFAIAIVALLVHVLTNRGYNFFRDEFYYIACGRHLAWGYVDHPPMVAVIAAWSHSLFGDSLAGLRFFPALAGALTVLLTGAIARDLGGGRFAQILAAVCALTAPVYLQGFNIYTMNAFEILLWTVALALLVRILKAGDPRQWVLFGIVAGIGLLTKHSMVFLLAGMVVGMLFTPARRHLGSPWLWSGAMIALAIVTPHLVWETRNGWPTLEFMANARQYKNARISAVDFFLGQVLLMNPVAAPVWIAGLGHLLVSKRAENWRPIGNCYLFILVLFIITQAKIYYLAPVYAVLFAAGGVALEGFTQRRFLGWLRPVLVVAPVLVGVLLAPVVLPVLPPATLVSYMHALRITPPESERHKRAALPQVYADMFGWEEMVAQVAHAYQALTPAERAQCAIFTSNYGEAGAIDFYGPRYGLPHAASGHNNYYLWGPPKDRGALVLTVGERPDDVAKTYHQVTEVARTHSEWCMPYENDVPILLGRDPIDRIQDIWPRCKKYI